MSQAYEEPRREQPEHDPFFTPASAESAPGADPASLATVRLVNAPLDVWARAEAHSDELMREFALISLAQVRREHRDVPTRLLELSAALSARYSAATSAPDQERQAAMAAGARRIDLTYVLPREARDDALRLEAMLAEADEYCRQGHDMLTLARPQELVDFAHWFIGEFVRQTDGGEPTPWPEAAG